MWFPVGIEDFAELRRNGYYFVDKTSFIQEFLDKRPKVLLMTRPRRFGKTLFMSMISYFFSQDDAKENRKLFRGLAIDRAGEKYMCEQGSRPIVFLTATHLVIYLISIIFYWMILNFRNVTEGSCIF